MTKTIDERELALLVLLEVTKDGEFSHIALRNTLNKYQYLEKKQRAFLTRVVEGTLEHMIEIDYIIQQFSNVKLNKMKPVIRTILRSSVYQIKYMDSVPNAAVCNEAVKLAAKKGFVTLKGFVNGVLRNIVRNLDSISYPDPETEPLRALSVRYSMPEWILQEWLVQYDRDVVETMLQDFLKEKLVTVRINPQIGKEALKEMLRKEGVTAEDHGMLPYALQISGFDYLGGLDSFLEGAFQVQDVSSMMVVEKAGVKDGDYVIDVCAAPGGKATHVAELLHGTGHVQARDLTDYKVELIEENIMRLGLTNIEAIKWDALVKDEKSVEKADIVIADLPCSGLGVLGKKTDLKYRMTKETQQELEELQRKILSTVQAYVKPGGTLLYSTCTINRGENEENVFWFVENFPEFTLSWGKQFLPGIDDCDGFYIARLEKRPDGKVEDEIHE